MSEQVNKYLNGKIYMIGSKHTDLVYIGSTCQSLKERLKNHENTFTRYKSGNYHMVTSFKILELGDYYILLLENANVETKKELEIIEGNYIKKYANVNMRIPSRTQKEYYVENKEKIMNYKKDYYDENKKDINEKHLEYYHKNKNEIKIKKNKQFNCPCGYSFTKSNQARHFKTSKHQQWEQNKTLNQ